MKGNLSMSMSVQPERKTVNVTDDDIVGIAAGNMECFERLYANISGSIYGYALSKCRNSQDAEDILQETFLTIYRKAGLYKPKGKPMAWILTITRNIIMMNYRNKGNMTGVAMENVENDINYARIESDIDRLTMETLLRKLDEDEREIIMLYVVFGYKHLEIAKQMGKPLSTVISRYNRAIKKMRTQL